MKTKIKLLISSVILIVITLVIYSCVKETAIKQNVKTEIKNNINNNHNTRIQNVAKFVLRWGGVDPINHPCHCPSCKCPQCPCPAGMCFCGGLAESHESEDMGADVGFANIWFDGVGSLHLSFRQETALTLEEINDTADVVPVTGDLYLTDTLSNLLGYSSVMIPEGYYIVDYTNNEFGEIKLRPEVEE